MPPPDRNPVLTDADHDLMARATQEALDLLDATDDATRRAVGIAIIEAFAYGERNPERLAEAALQRVGR